MNTTIFAMLFGATFSPPPPGNVFPDVALWGDSLSAQGDYITTITNNLSTNVGRAVDVYPGGRGSQRSEGISMRQGARPGLVDAVTVPASGGVTITFTNHIDVLNNDSGTEVTAGISCMLGNVNPIPGLLTKQNNGTISPGGGADCWPFVFTRSTTGTTRNIAAGEKMTLDTGEQNRARGHIIRIGHNNRNARACTGGGVDMTATTGPIAQQMYNYATGPAIVVSLITADPSLLGTDFDALSADATTVNNDLAARFGADFCNLRAYLSSKQALVDAGVITAAQNPSAGDQDAINRLYPPPSFQMGVHLNPTGQAVSGTFVTNHVISRGWGTL